MLLFVTQISLLDEEAFGRASTLLKEAKVNSMPFGGVRVIVVGDFAQLPTVHCNEPRPPLLFDHDSWNECDFHIVYLSQKRRCEDDGSWAVLQELRLHVPSRRRLSGLASTMLRSLVVTANCMFDGAHPVTHLFARRDEADAFNLSMLSNLPGQEIQVNASDLFEPFLDIMTCVTSNPNIELLTKALDRGVLARSTVCIKDGALVVLICSLRQIHPLLTKGVTGSIVHVQDGPPLLVRVQFKLPDPYGVICVDLSNDVEFSVMSNFAGVDYLLTRRSLPLLLGWGLTIHSSQGMTLPVRTAMYLCLLY